MGTIATYLIVLLQFKFSSPQENLHPSSSVPSALATELVAGGNQSEISGQE